MRYRIIYLLTVSVLLFACKENNDKVILHKLDHYLWQYFLGNKDNFEAMMPAIDSVGNIYLVRNSNGKNSILKLTYDGLKSEEFYEQAAIDTRPVIVHNRLYYHTKNNRIHCRDTKENTYYFQINQLCNTNLITWSDSRFYFCSVKNYAGQQVTHLLAYTLDGQKKWEKTLATEGDSLFVPRQITTYGNKIYIGLSGNEGNYLVLQITQEEITPSIAWYWTAPPSYSADALKEFSLDMDGNIYLGMETGISGENVLISLTPGGEKRWETKTALHFPIVSVSVDEEGSLYVADTVCQKISKEGKALWTSKGESGLAYTSRLGHSPLIHSSSSVAFIDDNRILTNVGAGGEKNWIQFIQSVKPSNNEIFLRLTQNRNGTILVLTNKRIMAFTAGEDAFGEQPWPKLYRDFGNPGGF